MQYVGTQSDGSVIALESMNETQTETEGRMVRLRPNAPPTREFFVTTAYCNPRRTTTDYCTVGGEWRTNVAVTILRTGSTAAAASVRVRTLDGTAQAGLDYDPLDVRLTFAPLEAAKVVWVHVPRDRLWEGLETFRVQLLEPEGAESTTGTWDVAVEDYENLPGLTVQRSPSGRPELRVTNPSGVRFEIQSSTDLRHWTQLETSSSQSITLPLGIGAAPARFYRMAAPQ